eukprot:scaffold1938_cov114-Skeletonema_dohrnii-CCMP3373.AAC.1
MPIACYHYGVLLPQIGARQRQASGFVAVVGWMDGMTAALILHYELLQGGSTPFVPICLVFVAPSWS